MAKGMKSQKHTLSNGKTVHIHSDGVKILLQIQEKSGNRDDPLAPSFKVAVELSALEALAIAEGLLSKVVDQSKSGALTCTSGRIYDAPA